MTDDGYHFPRMSADNSVKCFLNAFGYLALGLATWRRPILVADPDMVFTRYLTQVLGGQSLESSPAALAPGLVKNWLKAKPMS